MESANPPSFVWHEHRKRPNWIITCCVALGCGAGGYYVASLSNPAKEQTRPDLQKAELTTGMPEKDKQKPGVVAMREETRAPVPPVVVLNPGAGDRGNTDQPKETDSAATASRVGGAQKARRGADDGDEMHRSRRPQPTAYRSYKDLRNYTLNR